MEEKDAILQDLKDKVNKLEYVEIKKINSEISEMKIELNTNNILTKQSVESNQKLADTMDTLKSTMIELAQSVKESTSLTSNLTDKVQNLSDKVDKVEIKFNDRIEKINEKSKIDWQEFIKDNWLAIGIAIIGSAYLIAKALGISFMF